MRPDIETAVEHVAAARVRLGRAPLGEVDAQEIEDALCKGYAQALAGDAWLAQTEQRLHELIEDRSRPVRGRDVRALAAEHGDFQHGLIALRRELAAMRREHDRLLERAHVRRS